MGIPVRHDWDAILVADSRYWSGGEGCAEECGCGAHGAVVDDFGGAEHVDDAAGLVGTLVDGVVDLLERVERGGRVRGLVDADEDRVRTGDRVLLLVELFGR